MREAITITDTPSFLNAKAMWVLVYNKAIERLKAQAAQEPIERTGWFIEFNQTQPSWINSIHLDDGFTSDAKEAILFPRKRCAADVLKRFFNGSRNNTAFKAARECYRITEHLKKRDGLFQFTRAI